MAEKADPIRTGVARLQPATRPSVPMRALGNTIVPPNLTVVRPREEPPREDDNEVTRRTEVPSFTNGEPRMLRLSMTGAIMSGNGSQQLAEMASYAAQLADLVGELLGIDGCAALEFSLSDGACVVARQANGDLVVVRGGRSSDVATLKKRLEG